MYSIPKFRSSGCSLRMRRCEPPPTGALRKRCIASTIGHASGIAYFPMLCLFRLSGVAAVYVHAGYGVATSRLGDSYLEFIQAFDTVPAGVGSRWRRSRRAAGERLYREMDPHSPGWGYRPDADRRAEAPAGGPGMFHALQMSSPVTG